MSEMLGRLDETVAWLAREVGAAPRIGVVLGSGWDAFADAVSPEVDLAYARVPHFPTPEVHAGVLRVGSAAHARVACLRGRCHGYEGRSPEEVVYPVRALARWGVSTMVLTNAAGGIADDLAPGDFMLLGDHVNLTATNPLVGLGDALGPGFVDMTEAYDPALRARARGAAEQMGLSLRSGVYGCTLGPMYETPAEIRAMCGMGVDAVGMSTVWEAIALRQMGVPLLAISCITNRAAGLGGEPLSHAHVLTAAERVQAQAVSLLRGVVGSMAGEGRGAEGG